MRFPRVLLEIATSTCEAAASLVSGSLDGRPTATGRISLRLHLLCCPRCRRFVRQMTLLRSAMARLKWGATGEFAPPGLQLPPAARERIGEAIADARRAAPP